MTTEETPLEMEIRHVAEQQARIVKQEALIERLRKVGAPLHDALDLLCSMRALLETMLARKRHLLG
jgi:hypothetical protein